MENIISSSLIHHIEEEPSHIQHQNSVTLNRINVEIIPPRESQQVNGIFICTDGEILTSKNKHSPSDYTSDNSSEYESAGSTKSSSTQSVNEVVNQEMGSEKVATPTLLGNALKAIKNVFSPSEKGRNKPSFSSTSTAEKEISSHSENLENGLDSKKMDYLDVSALGARLSSISLESQNLTDDSFTTVVSRTDDSFQSAITHFDEHNTSDSESNNQTKSDETFIEIHLDLDMSCNETLGAQDNNILEETLLRRNSLDSPRNLAQIVNNSVLENFKTENSSPIVDGKGIKCSTPITGNESVIIINNSELDKSEDLLGEKILNSEEMGGGISSEREIDRVDEENKTFEIKKNEANETNFNLEEGNSQEVMINNKTYELEAKDFIKEAEEKAISLEKSISESFDGNETFNLNSVVEKNCAESEKTFNVVNDQTFDLGEKKSEVEGLAKASLDELVNVNNNTFSLGDKSEAGPEISESGEVELERTFNLDGEKKLQECLKPEVVDEAQVNFNSAPKIVTGELKSWEFDEMVNLESVREKEGSLGNVVENSLPENLDGGFFNSQIEEKFSENNLESVEFKKNSSEVTGVEVPVENLPNGLEFIEESVNGERKAQDLAGDEKMKVEEPGLEIIDLGESGEVDKISSKEIANEIRPQAVVNGSEVEENIQRIVVDSVENENIEVKESVPEISGEILASKSLEEMGVEKIKSEPELSTQDLRNGDLNEAVELEKPCGDKILTENLSISLEKINLSVKNESEPEIPAQGVVEESEVIEKSPNSEENTEKFSVDEKIEPKPSVPEMPNQVLPINLSVESLKAEEVNSKSVGAEILTENLPNGFGSAEESPNFQGQAVELSEAEKLGSEPGILAQNLSEDLELQSSEPEKDNCANTEPENFKSNEYEALDEKPADFPESAELEKMETELNSPDSLDSTKSFEKIESTEESPLGELKNEKLEVLPEIFSPDRLEDVQESEKFEDCNEEPEEVHEIPIVPEIRACEDLELDEESLSRQEVKKESPVAEVLPQNRPNGFESVENLLSPEEKTAEPGNFYLESPMPRIISHNLSKITEEGSSFVASPIFENEKLEKSEISPGNLNLKENGVDFENANRDSPMPPENAKNGKNSLYEFSSTFEVNLNNSRGKDPETSEIKPDESIKTESDNTNSTFKSVINSPFDFLDKSRNIFHDLSNTPPNNNHKKFDPDSEDLILGMENLKLDDSLKFAETDDKDFFGKIENNLLIEDKLSSPTKSDKTESDTDLAQLIQEQFSANDIEKICSVVDEIPMASLNRQIMRASQLFEKSFHEKFLADEVSLNIQNSLSPEGLDYLDQLETKSGGRDFSRESLYVKFDPLIEPKKVEEARTEILLDISPPRQPVNVVAPLNRKPEENHSRVKELQEEIKRLTQLYLDRELANNEKINEYENQIAKLTGQACILENKLKESGEREKALVRKINEQSKSIDDLKMVMEQYTIVIQELAKELEEVKRKNKEEQFVLIAERDSYMTHLQNTEAAFSDVHSKYEKSKKTIESYKKNEIMYRNTISEQSQLIEDYKEKATEVKEKAVRELNKIRNEMDEMKSNHAQEASRVRAQLRKTELKVQALQESLDQKIKENEELTTICDDLIAGKK